MYFITFPTVKSEFFVRFFFANSVKRHICDINNSQLGHEFLCQ